jgi:hypothetical protein
MRRRTFVSAGLSALACTAAATGRESTPPRPTAPTAAAAGDGSADASAARLAATLTGPALLEAFVRMRARTDGRPAYGWLRSQRSTVVDGDVRPLFDVVAGAVQRFERIAEDRYEATLLEVAHYTDPATGEPLASVEMPGTGRRVAVPSYRFGPVKARFAVALDEWEEFDPPQGGRNAAEFVPRSSVHLVRGLSAPTAVASRVHVRADEFGRVHPERAKPHTVFYREWMVWRAEAAALGDRGAPHVAADYGYTALTSWRPWMQMGDVRGHTADSGYGAKALSWEECPAHFLELTRRLHPDVLDDPERALRGKPA